MLQSLNSTSRSEVIVGNHAIKLSTAQQDPMIRSQSLNYRPNLEVGYQCLLLGEAITHAVADGLFINLVVNLSTNQTHPLIEPQRPENQELLKFARRIL